MPPLGEDTAEELIAIFTALGAVNQVNALGNVAAGPVALPDPTVQAVTVATLTASGVAWTLPQPSIGKKLRLALIQGAGGSFTLGTVTTPLGGALKWQAGAAPTLTVTAGHTDVLEFECIDGVNWFGKATLNYN